ncbi:protein of unknown function (DUF4750) [Mactra antiquata]
MRNSSEILRFKGEQNENKEAMTEILLPFISLIASLFFVILFIAFGWYVVWTLFLKKFGFVRELLGVNGPETSTKEKTQRTRKTRKD